MRRRAFLRGSRSYPAVHDLVETRFDLVDERLVDVSARGTGTVVPAHKADGEVSRHELSGREAALHAHVEDVAFPVHELDDVLESGKFGLRPKPRVLDAREHPRCATYGTILNLHLEDASSSACHLVTSKPLDASRLDVHGHRNRNVPGVHLEVREGIIEMRHDLCFEFCESTMHVFTLLDAEISKKSDLSQ